MSVHWGGPGAGHVSRWSVATTGVPVLSLDFLTSNTLDPRITFSRTTNATLVDATGRVTYAPNNLVLYSEQFDDAAWTKTASTITPNAAAAPNGTTTADKLVETTAASTGHFIAPAVAGAAVVAGQFFIYSVYAKAGERTFLQLIATGIGPGGSNLIAGFNLTDGTAGTPSPTLTSAITSVGDGWYRCSMAIPVATTAVSSLQIRLSLNSTSTPSSYTGDGTSGLFIWGAQLEQVTYQTLPSTYVQTVASAYYAPRFDYNPVTLAPNGLLIEEQRVNLALYSERFDNAAWVKLRASVMANATTSPDGTASADKLIDDGLSIGVGFINQSITYTNVTHKFSFYAKAGEVTSVTCYIIDTVGVVAASIATINLTNGLVTAGSAIVTNAGNGWYRIEVSGLPSAGLGGARILLPADTATTNGFFIWGAQVEAGAFATSYIPTVASTVTRAADVAVMTGTNFSSWYNQSAGTIVVQATAYGNKASSTLTRIQDAAATTNFITARQSASGTQILGQTSSSGGLTAGLGATNFTIGAPFKIAVASAPSDVAASVNGGTVGTSTAMTTMPVVDRLNISESGPFYVRQITYYPSRLTNAQLQALTA